jgi:hypothetical protein
MFKMNSAGPIDARARKLRIVGRQPDARASNIARSRPFFVIAAARQCVELAARFRQEKPDQWLEDWGGGPNPALL